MKLLINSPIKAYIEDYDDIDLHNLKQTLTYTNTGVQHLIKRHYNNHFWKNRNSVSWQNHLIELQKDLKKCLVYKEGDKYFIRPGTIPYLHDFNIQVENQIEYPEFHKIPWLHPLPFELHPYQEESWTKLLAEKHGNIQICTGGGKSGIILKLCREMGLNACIIAPGKAIFNELIEKFEHHFGKKFVGAFGDGKRKLDRKFTVCIGDSIANVKPGSSEYDFFSNLDLLLCDESHIFASESLETICHGVLGNIPYRFFLSATQTRGDGSLPLLRSIIGRTVCSLTTAEAVQKGYICPHDFRIVTMDSSNPSFDSSDALALKRAHFLNNKNIAHFVARLANGMADIQGKQTLVLCEELTQLSMLAPLLKVPYALAHSEKKADRLAELGLEKVNVAESIDKFNKNEVKVLITTSCCHVGVNIFPTHQTINWVGGASEIKTKQAAVGRSVRFGHSNPWAKNCVPKDKATIYDFDIQGNEVMTRHLEARIEYYKESGTEIKYIRFK